MFRHFTFTALIVAGISIASAANVAPQLPPDLAKNARESAAASLSRTDIGQKGETETIAPPPVRKGERISDWEWNCRITPERSFSDPVKSMYVAQPKDDGRIAAPARVPGKPTYGSYIPKDPDVRGTYNYAIMSITEGVDGVDTVFNMGNAGTKILMNVDEETGLVTIKPQRILVHNRYGDVYIYSCKVENNQLIYDENADITGSIDAKGRIRLQGWGIFVAQGENKGAWFAAYSRSDWNPTNTKINHKLIDGTESNLDALVEQSFDNQLTVYNFCGANNPIAINLNPDKSIRITPQLIFTNEMWGPFYNYPTIPVDGRYQIDMAGYTEGKGDDRTITTGSWAVFSRLPGVSQTALAAASTTITTGFNIRYPEAVAGEFEGQGTEASPYLIKTADDLRRLAQKTATDNFKGKHFRLANDINLAGLSAVYQPIGDDTAPFEGTFDGNGKKLTGLTLNGLGNHYVGLFGMLGADGTVKNLTAEGFRIASSGQWKAPIVADNDGTISGITVTNALVLSDGESSGGITARSTGRVEDCSFSGTIQGSGNVAGIVGYNYGKIYRCQSDAQIQRVGHISDVYRDCAGIAGTSASQAEYTAEIADCVFRGTLTDSHGFGIVGGIVGKLSNSSLTRSLSTAAISHQRNDESYDNYTGGLAGWISASTISDCFNAGTIVKSSSRGLESESVGGLVGYVRVMYSFTGGGPAEMRDKSKVERCYNSGQVISMLNRPNKGIWGQTFTYQGQNPIPETFIDCYFDEQVNGYSDGEFGRQTEFFTAGNLPAGFSADLWTAEKGRYPVLTALKENPGSQLASSALILSDGEQINKVKKEFTLSSPAGIVWKLLDTASGNLVDETAALKINGNKVSIKNSYATDLMAAYTPDGNSTRIFRVAVVPHLFDGEGTEQSPYLIKSVADFRTLNSAVSDYAQPHIGDFFRMTADIDFASASDFKGVGAGKGLNVSFGGSFDGDGHTIHNFKVQAYQLDENLDPVNGSFYNFVGLFGACNPYSTIKNLNLAADCSFKGYSYTGSIAGYTEGRIDNCRNYADVYSLRQYAAGIVGYAGASASVNECYNSGRVNAAYSGMGGIVGYNRGAISVCQNDGDVQGLRPDGSEASQSLAGGIAGYSSGSIADCVNNASVRANSMTGGLVGQLSANDGPGEMLRSLNNGIVTLTQEVSSRGGLAGNAGSHGKVENNYYDGGSNIHGASANGALVGCASLPTATLTSGNLPEGFDANLWDVKAGMLPVLKKFASEPAGTSLRSLFVNFPNGQSRSNVTVDIPLSTASGCTWSLKENKNFTLGDNTLRIEVPTGMSMASDTLTATLGNATKVYMVKSVAKIFKGDGTLESPYLIETTEDMVKLAEFIDLTSFDYSGFNFLLVNDLDFNGAEWKVIAPNTTRFNANFDGNGKTIKGYKFENLDNKTGVGRFVGPFGVVGQSGAIRNLTMAGSFKARQYAGGVAGDLYGVIDNCINRSEVNTLEGGAAGIVSRTFAGSMVSNCRNEGSVTAKGTVNGGIVATIKAEATVKDCVNDGDVVVDASAVGGIAGESAGAIIGCRNLKPVVGSSSVGGIVANGQPAATEITDCHNEAEIRLSNLNSGQYAAGIIGRTYTLNNVGSSTVISGCSNSGRIVAKGNSGGIVGALNMGASVHDCVNTGTISNTGASYAGGILGNSMGSTSVYNCVNHGKIEAHWQYAGGVAGLVCTGMTIDNCYNDGEVTMTPTEGINYQFANTIAIGGFAGSIRGIATNCWNSGNVSSDYVAVGGLCGILSGENADGTPNVYNCFNTGDVSAKGNLAGTNGQAGGLAGYNVSKPITVNFVNFGKISAAGRSAGLIGSIHGTATITNSYNAGEVVTQAADEAAGVANIAGNGTLIDNGVYFDSDVMKAGKDDKGYMAKSTRELIAADLGEGFIYSEAAYPMPDGIEDDGTLAHAAALAITNLESDSADELTSYVLIGNTDKVDWSCSEHFIIYGNKAYPAKLGQGTLTATSADGKRVKTYSFNITKVSGVDGIAADKEVVSRTYFDLDGRQIAEPAPGSVCIVRTIYIDGTSATEKLLVP